MANYKRKGKYQYIEGLLRNYKKTKALITNYELDKAYGLEIKASGLHKQLIIKQKIENMLDILTDKELEVITLKYIDGLTWQQVEAKAKINISVERQLRRVKNAAMKKLMEFVND